MKRLFICILLVVTMAAKANASWATKMANGFKNTTTWVLPSTEVIGGFHFHNYPEHYAALLEKMGAIHRFKNFDEFYTAHKFDEFVTLLDRKENSKPVYFFDESFADKQKPITLTRFGWLLTTTSFNDLVTKKPESISAVEKAARLNMSIEYYLKSSNNEAMQASQRAVPVLSLAVLQHTIQKYAFNNITLFSWLKKPTTKTQKILAPLALGAVGIANCYAQAKCFDYIKTLQSKNDMQKFVDQLSDFEKTLLPAYARMAEEFNFSQEQQDVLKKAVAELKLKK